MLIGPICFRQLQRQNYIVIEFEWNEISINSLMFSKLDHLDKFWHIYVWCEWYISNAWHQILQVPVQCDGYAIVAAISPHFLYVNS